MAKDVPPVPRGSLIDPSTGRATSVGQDFFERLASRVGGAGNRGVIIVAEVQIKDEDLASAGARRLLRARPKESWYLRDMIVSRVEVWSGGGGDRNLQIKDAGGTISWSIAPAAQLQTGAPSVTIFRWGETPLPWPATTSDYRANSPAGKNIIAQYSGGTTDYTAGSWEFVLFFEQAQ